MHHCPYPIAWPHGDLTFGKGWETMTSKQSVRQDQQTSMSTMAVRDFSAPSTGGKTFRLSECKSRKLVLYFYPKDNTPGCTAEGAKFRDLYAEFRKEGAEIYGISRDSPKSHENFKAKMAFPFDLLSDEDEKICILFSVIKMKNMYGRQVRGIERSTFVLDANRVIRREWRGVKVPGHVQEVLEFAKTI
jgi:peroxiredoxin Q/BCP